MQMMEWIEIIIDGDSMFFVQDQDFDCIFRFVEVVVNGLVVFVEFVVVGNCWVCVFVILCLCIVVMIVIVQFDFCDIGDEVILFGGFFDFDFD